MYSVQLSKQAEKMIRQLPAFVVKGFQDKFLQLANNPYEMAGVDTIKNTSLKMM